MRTINRFALLVRPKEPYLKWAADLDDDSGDALTLRGETSVYLVAEDPEGRQESPPLELYFEEIFESELAAWYLDESAWPENRDLEMFLAWFEVEARSLVWDLDEARLVRELLAASCIRRFCELGSCSLNCIATSGHPMPLTRLTLSSILILISSSASAEIEDAVILEHNWHLAIDDDSHSSNGSVWLPFETEITLPRPDADPSVGPFAGELYVTGKCFVAGGEQSYYIPRWRERGTSANVFASDKCIKLWIAGANPTSSACVFHGFPDSDSTGFRTLIPRQSGH